MAKRFLSTINLPRLSSDPVSGSEGELYYNSTTDTVRIYNGTVWSNLSGAGSSSNSFETLSTPNGTSPVADSATDTLTITESNGMVITGNSTNDSIQFSTNATSLNTASTIISRDSDQAFDITGIDFDTTDTITSAVGRVSWDSGEGTLSLGLKGGNLNLKLGQENIALCYNETGSQINKGSVVYISGAQGQRPSISLADADTEATSSKTFGVAAENIANGAEGFVATFGAVPELNTSGFTEGQSLWLSSTAGQLTNVRPTQPVHSVFVGYCLRSHASSGRIFVNPQNGYEIEELHNVLISSPNLNHILYYDNVTQLWKNKSLYNSIYDIGNIAISGHLSLNSGGVININGSQVLSATQYAGNAATVTNGVITTESYTNPSWIISLPWTKITSTPTTISGYGITDAQPLNTTLTKVSQTPNVANTIIYFNGNSETIFSTATLTEYARNLISAVDASAARTTLNLGNVENVAVSTFSGSSNITSLGTITSGTWNATPISASYIDSTIARLAGPTFTGTVVLPSTTSIGDVSSTEISYLDGVTSAIQTQLNAKLASATASVTYAPLASPSFTGTVSFSGATVTGIDLLPSQTSNSGKFLTTNGSAASWSFVAGSSYSNDAPSSPVVGQIWVESDVDVSSFDPRIFIRWNKVLSSSQSTFSGVGSNGVVLEYTPGFEQVYLNGVLLLRSTDYTASDGSTIILSSSAVSGDVVEVVAQNVTSVANTYSQAQVDSALALKANLSSPTFTGTLSASNVLVSGTLDIQEIRETVNSITLSSNVGTLDWTTGNIYFISTAPSANMTWNLTNVPTDNGKAMNITVFVTQGSTGYIPSTVNVNGSAVTVKWPNGITPTPTSSAGKIDIFTLTLIRLSSSWTVIGNASTNF